MAAAAACPSQSQPLPHDPTSPVRLDEPNAPIALSQRATPAASVVPPPAAAHSPAWPTAQPVASRPIPRPADRPRPPRRNRGRPLRSPRDPARGGVASGLRRAHRETSLLSMMGRRHHRRGLWGRQTVGRWRRHRHRGCRDSHSRRRDARGLMRKSETIIKL